MTVEQLIDELDLTSKCRKRELVYTRLVLFQYLRTQKMTMYAIGNIFNKDHSTVVYGLKQYELLDKNKKHYPDFARIKEDVLIQLGLTPKLKPKAEVSYLERKVLDCKNYMDLKALQEELQKVILEREEEELFTTFDI
jgi:hypothetical protein